MYEIQFSLLPLDYPIPECGRLSRQGVEICEACEQILPDLDSLKHSGKVSREKVSEKSVSITSDFVTRYKLGFKPYFIRVFFVTAPRYKLGYKLTSLQNKKTYKTIWEVSQTRQNSISVSARSPKRFWRWEVPDSLLFFSDKKKN